MSERTKAGLARVRSHGKKLGRPRLKELSNASRATIWRRKSFVHASEAAEDPAVNVRPYSKFHAVTSP